MGTRTRAGQIALLLLALVCVATISTVRAYPGRFVSRYANGDCSAQLQLGQTYPPHAGPVAVDSSITFQASLNGVAATDKLCAGETYDMAITLPGGRAYLLTASQGALGASPDTTCPGRQLAAPPPLVEALSTKLAVPCTATGTVRLVISTAKGPGQQHLQNSVTYNVDASCKPASCSGAPAPGGGTGGAPTDGGSTGGLTQQMTAFVSAVNSATGCSSGPANSNGYACNRAPAGQMTLSYTISSSPVPPNNPCTKDFQESAKSLTLPQGSHAWMHGMFSSATGGWIALSFAQTAGKMFPATAILGGVPDNGGASFVDTYDLSGYTLGPSSKDTGKKFAYNLGAVQQSSPNTVTMICFSRPVSISGLSSGPNGRRLMQTADSTATSLTSALNFNWATSSTDQPQKHTAKGGFTINAASGGALAAAADNLKHKTTVHGALLMTAFVGLMPLAMLVARHKDLLPDKEVGGKALWFWIHLVLQIIAVGLFAGGVGLALAQFPRNNMPYEASKLDAHWALGITAIIAVFIQLLIGTIRPDKEHSFRKVWAFMHFNWGRLTMLLGWANVGLGIWIFNRLFQYTTLEGGDEPYKAWTIAAAVVAGFWVLAAVVLELISCTRRRDPTRGPRTTTSSAGGDGADGKFKQFQVGEVA